MGTGLRLPISMLVIASMPPDRSTMTPSRNLEIRGHWRVRGLKRELDQTAVATCTLPIDLHRPNSHLAGVLVDARNSAGCPLPVLSRF